MTERVGLERGKSEGFRVGFRVGRRVTRSRRWWAVVAASAVLTVGLAYEFIRFDHAVVGHMPALVVAVLLAVAVVVVVADPGRSRIGRALLGVALAFGLQFAVSQLRTADADPLVGEWTASFEGVPPTTVTITKSAVGYTVMAKTPARLPGYQCDLAVGTVLATFDGAAGHGGWQLLGYPSDCRLAGWEPATFDLVGARSLQEKVPSQHNLLFTKIG
jgi:hypothetical protein